VAVAFDKLTGQEKWKALAAKEQGYCPPTLIHHGGADQLLIWDAETLHSLNPQTGAAYWSLPIAPGFGMSIAAPRLAGDLLFVSGIGPAGGIFKLDPAQPAVPETVWKADPKHGVSCSTSTPFIREGVIYGVDCRSGGLRAVDIASGNWLWETWLPTTGERRANSGTAFLVEHGAQDVLFIEQGRFHILRPTGEAFGRDVVWSQPAFAHGCCFARNDEELVCVSLKK
jgi:outer membrane protein assembly factor BamB